MTGSVRGYLVCFVTRSPKSPPARRHVVSPTCHRKTTTKCLNFSYPVRSYFEVIGLGATSKIGARIPLPNPTTHMPIPWPAQTGRFVGGPALDRVPLKSCGPSGGFFSFFLLFFFSFSFLFSSLYVLSLSAGSSSDKCRRPGHTEVSVRTGLPPRLLRHHTRS